METSIYLNINTPGGLRQLFHIGLLITNNIEVSLIHVYNSCKNFQENPVIKFQVYQEPYKVSQYYKKANGLKKRKRP